MFKRLILKNKARLILAPLSETKAVTVLVLFKVGSRYETARINGVSHFLEHMFYKGTKRRPDTLSIARELDSVGAEYNAFTSKDYTGYYIKIHHKKLELALDILSDIIHNSKFEQKEIIKEKSVIVEEINMYEDNPLMYVDDLFEGTIFGSSPLGRLISGSRENVKSIKRKDILKYKKSFYRPSNMYLTVVGRYEEKNITGLIEQYFGWTGEKKKAPAFSKFSFNQKKPSVSLRYQKTEQVQAIFGFPAFSYFHKDIYALYLLSIILGGSMSSRLFIEIREERGLCYFIKAAPTVFEDTGHFSIQAGLDKSRVFEALEVIWQELKKIKKEGIKSAELKWAKDFMKGKLALSLEESSEIASYLAKQDLLTGKIEKPEEKFKKIDRVKKEDVNRVARKIINKKLINLAVIGPFEKKSEFSRFIDQKLK